MTLEELELLAKQERLSERKRRLIEEMRELLYQEEQHNAHISDRAEMLRKRRLDLITKCEELTKDSFEVLNKLNQEDNHGTN